MLSQRLQKPLKAMVHKPQNHPCPGLLQPSLCPIHRGPSRAGFSLGEAGLTPRQMGAASCGGREGLQDGSAAPLSLDTSAKYPMHSGQGSCGHLAPQLHPGASPFLGQLSQVSSGPGSCMDHTVQFVIFAKSASVLCLSLPVYKREGAMKSLLQQVCYVSSLSEKRIQLLQGVCVSKREKERR